MLKIFIKLLVCILSCLNIYTSVVQTSDAMKEVYGKAKVYYWESEYGHVAISAQYCYFSKYPARKGSWVKRGPSGKGYRSPPPSLVTPGPGRRPSGGSGAASSSHRSASSAGASPDDTDRDSYGFFTSLQDEVSFFNDLEPGKNHMPDIIIEKSISPSNIKAMTKRIDHWVTSGSPYRVFSADCVETVEDILYYGNQGYRGGFFTGFTKPDMPLTLMGYLCCNNGWRTIRFNFYQPVKLILAYTLLHGTTAYGRKLTSEETEREARRELFRRIKS